MIGKAVVSAGAGVAAAFASALCCAGPVLAVAVGVSGAGLSSTFEPLRPYFLGAAMVSLGLGFYLLHREENEACEPGRVCANARVQRTMRLILWIATGIAVVFATYPTWSAWIL